MDIVPFTFGQSLENLKHMEIASALWISPIKIMEPWPDEQSRLKVTIRPFQLPVCFKIIICFNDSFSNFHIDFGEKVWFCFLGLTFFFIFVTVALIKSTFNQTGGSSSSIYTTAYRQLEYVLKIITNQGM